MSESTTPPSSLPAPMRFVITDLWFDWQPNGPRLRLSVPSWVESLPSQFLCQIGPEMAVPFRLITYFKGQRVYEAVPHDEIVGDPRDGTIPEIRPVGPYPLAYGRRGVPADHEWSLWHSPQRDRNKAI